MKKNKGKILEEEMPDDFWNYLVNPIVGYYVDTIFRESGYKNK
jgi:hypothetical protein